MDRGTARPTSNLLKRGTLFSAAEAANRRGHQCGALQPIGTRTEFVTDENVRFVLRILTERRAPKPHNDPAIVEKVQRNPFLPYDANLFVADITPTHVCLLNKYTVIDHHLLLVTRTFEHQEQWLTLADFEAFCACMAEFEGLAFYNGGNAAGASQPHKHLQYVPFPLAASGEDIPMAVKLHETPIGHIVTTLPLPFKHAFLRFDTGTWQDAPKQATDCFRQYAAMLAAAGADPSGVNQGGRQTCAYNLLATRDWMLLVLRQQDAVNGISVNGLGFAGHLLARDRDQAEFIRQTGALDILSRVGVPIS